MKRKLVSVLLCLSFVFGVFPFQIAFADDYTLIYKIENGAVTITGLSNPSYSGDVVIPELLEGYSVNSISNNAFKNCSGITSVSIPSTVITIGESAFSNCNSITAVYYQSSLTDWCNKISINSYGNTVLNS
ncbi:MAG: leucine-rich repeat protein, partial [Clostridia bacterium]|nr:leucine-rich repeat protein [Clostridia bacterium]